MKNYMNIHRLLFSLFVLAWLVYINYSVYVFCHRIEFPSLQVHESSLLKMKDGLDENKSFVFKHEKIITSEDLKLDALYISESAQKSNKLVILFHGFHMDKYSLVNEASAFIKMGLDVLLVDFRAHGNSDGEVITFGLDEAKDVRSTYEYAKNLGYKEILLYGSSMGAVSIVRAVSSFDLEPKKIILEMPYLNVKNLIKAFYRHSGEHVLNSYYIYYLPLFYLSSPLINQIDMLNDLKRITTSVMINWGSFDIIVSRDDFDLIRSVAGKTSTINIYENSGHQSFLINDKDKWEKEISKFLN